MADDILHQLRVGTKDQHEQLESAVQIGHRLNDAGRYAELLELFLGWYRPMEQKLEAIPGWEKYGIDIRSRRKSQWLEEDLRALADHSASLGDCPALPRVETLAEAFGCAYVIEGSTLGGRHIAAMLQDSPIPPGARRFFTSYGAEVGPRWKEFVSALGAFASDSHADDEIVRAAQEAFASMQRWISSVTPVAA